MSQNERRFPLIDLSPPVRVTQKTIDRDVRRPPPNGHQSPVYGRPIVKILPFKPEICPCPYLPADGWSEKNAIGFDTLSETLRGFERTIEPVRERLALIQWTSDVHRRAIEIVIAENDLRRIVRSLQRIFRGLD